MALQPTVNRFRAAPNQTVFDSVLDRSEYEHPAPLK